METRANHALVGAFTLCVLAAAFAFIYWIVSTGTNSSRAEVIYVFKGAVIGLAKGSPVYFNGIKVGEVTALSLDKDNPDQAVANAIIDGDTPVKEDTRSELGIQGLTGVAYIDMRGGSSEKETLLTPDFPLRIDAQASSIQDFFDAARRIIKRVDTMVGKVETVVETNGPVVTQVLANVNSFSQALASNADNVQAMLSDIASASKRIADMSDDLSRVIGKTDSLLAGVEPDMITNIVANVERTTAGLAGISDDARALLGDGRQFIGTLNKASLSLTTTLSDVQGLVSVFDRQQLSQSVDHLHQFTQQLPKMGEQAETILQKADSVANDFQDVSQTLVGKKEQINQIIDYATLIASRLERASKRIDGIFQKVDDLLGTDEANNLLVDARQAAKSLRVMADQLAAQAGPIARDVSRFTSRGLKDVEALIGDGRSMLNRLDRVLGTIENNPQSLIFGRDDVPEYNGRRK